MVLFDDVGWGDFGCYGGGVAVGPPVTPTVDAGLAFDPVVHALPGLDPDGLLQSVRAGAYAGRAWSSKAARAAEV